MRRDLSDHLRDVGMSAEYSLDPTTHLSVTMADGMLNVVESAMLTEGIHPEVVKRVVRLAMYGVIGSPAEVQQRKQLQAIMLEKLHEITPSPVSPPLQGRHLRMGYIPR